MRSVKKSYLINAPVKEVWKALVDPVYIKNWGGGPAKMDDKVGTKFSMWGNQIHGKNLEVDQQKKLVQEWWGGRWDEPSITTFTLHSTATGKTRLKLLHTKIPNTEYKDIDKGWDEDYLGAIKKYLEKK